jgi:hypothetical protein
MQRRWRDGIDGGGEGYLQLLCAGEGRESIIAPGGRRSKSEHHERAPVDHHGRLDPSGKLNPLTVELQL